MTPELKFERTDLRQFAEAHPDDKALASLVSLAREQNLNFSQGEEHPGLIEAAQATREEIDDHKFEQGYIWPQSGCPHKHVTARSDHFRCKACGMTKPIVIE